MTFTMKTACVLIIDNFYEYITDKSDRNIFKHHAKTHTNRQTNEQSEHMMAARLGPHETGDDGSNK